MKILKYILASLLFSFISLSGTLAQSNNNLPKDLTIAFKQGNSVTLANYFGDRIQLQIHDKEATHSKSQAKQIMTKFFKDFPPTEFKKKHIGGKPGARYVIGYLHTKKGNFRINFLLKDTSGKPIVHQLRIEKD